MATFKKREYRIIETGGHQRISVTEWSDLEAVMKSLAVLGEPFTVTVSEYGTATVAEGDK